MIAGATRQGGYTKEGGDDVGGKLYSEKKLAALKGYCRVVNPHEIPAIWDAFQQARDLLEEFAFHTRPYSNASVSRATG